MIILWLLDVLLLLFSLFSIFFVFCRCVNGNAHGRRAKHRTQFMLLESNMHSRFLHLIFPLSLEFFSVFRFSSFLLFANHSRDTPLKLFFSDSFTRFYLCMNYKVYHSPFNSKPISYSMGSVKVLLQILSIAIAQSNKFVGSLSITSFSSVRTSKIARGTKMICSSTSSTWCVCLGRAATTWNDKKKKNMLVSKKAVSMGEFSICYKLTEEWNFQVKKYV